MEVLLRSSLMILLLPARGRLVDRPTDKNGDPKAAAEELIKQRYSSAK